MEPAIADGSRVTLSTGHEIELPLELSFAVGGVTVPARRERLAALLPSDLSALAVAPGIGCVTFVGIQYHRVGGESNERNRGTGDRNDGPNERDDKPNWRNDESADERRVDTGLEPYNEFAVIVPAVRGGQTDAPFAQIYGGEIGGYVHWLPVTTDASVALGREIWGYPKERADITVTDGPRGLRCVVADAGDDRRGEDGSGGHGGRKRSGNRERVRFEVPRPRTRVADGRRDWTLWSYTTKGGDLLRTKAEVWGDVALGSPLGATLEVDPALEAELGCWSRPLVRLYGARVRARLHKGERVGDA
ncbi:acetoacetate decarboxylase family protein [Haloterrigena alkaliphila]|uniref:Acetoacetate decarboxylase family protein n=1 Tax=Haloterrigena alkaliphila TaxID=2816475 RepID=A0A8A2VHM9_9EURY|nr:acetoacetate decarboxylase family protein [Haloterrigena alkaliphila]QSX00168.1 acetoacetate decarboxylase family protein [Haloterrigena alkaliphila]